MAYNNMNTKFTDNRTGEEYEFLGTNITFSERELMNLEQEYDEAEDKRFVARLICTGFFEEEWTDYYAETDAEDDDNDGQETEVERAYSAGHCVVHSDEAAEGTECPLNVPLKSKKPAVADFKELEGRRFTFPAPAAVPPYTVNSHSTPHRVQYEYDCHYDRYRCCWAATMSELHSVFILNAFN